MINIKLLYIYLSLSLSLSTHIYIYYIYIYYIYIIYILYIYIYIYIYIICVIVCVSVCPYRLHEFNLVPIILETEVTVKNAVSLFFVHCPFIGWFCLAQSVSLGR